MTVKHPMLVVLALLLVACGGGGGGGGESSREAGGSQPPAQSGATLTVSPRALDLSHASGTFDLDVNPGDGTTQWSVSLTDQVDWVSVQSEDSGAGAGLVRLFVDKNMGPPRATTLSVSGGGLNANVTISQTAARRHQSPNPNWSLEFYGIDYIYEDYLSANMPWSHRLADSDDDPIRYGTSSHRFEVRPGECGGADCDRTPAVRERSEFAQIGNQNYEGDEYWYGWSFFVPEDFEDTGNIPGTSRTLSIAQFHQSPTFHPAWMFRKEFGGPMHVVQFPTISAEPSETFALISDDKFRGRWHDIVVHATWTTEDNGFFRVWVNGEAKLDYSGKTRTAGNDYIYHKFGVYRIADPDNATNTVLYFDEISRGGTRDEVDIRRIELGHSTRPVREPEPDPESQPEPAPLECDVAVVTSDISAVFGSEVIDDVMYFKLDVEHLADNIVRATYLVQIRNAGERLLEAIGRPSSEGAGELGSSEISFGDLDAGAQAQGDTDLVVNHVCNDAVSTIELNWSFRGAPGDGVPPDPGPQGDQSLAGVDSDGDGIRDDLERMIALAHPTSPPKRSALRRTALALQNTFEARHSMDDARSKMLELAAATNCMLEVFGDDASVTLRWLENRFTNTLERLEAYDQFNKLLDGTSFTFDSSESIDGDC